MSTMAQATYISLGSGAAIQEVSTTTTTMWVPTPGMEAARSPPGKATAMPSFVIRILTGLWRIPT